MASIMSMPSTERSSQALWVCGRANTKTIITKVKARSTPGKSISLTRQLLGA